MQSIAKKLIAGDDEPIFALDIGHSTMKIMEVNSLNPDKPAIIGYGISGIYNDTTLGPNGDIVRQEDLAAAMIDLFKNRLVGTITTKKVACTIPTSHTFSRLVTLPKLENSQIDEAVRLEVEQYVPMPVDSLYIDHEKLRETEQGMEVLLVATPKKIIDSYMEFLHSMSLSPVALEPTMNASARLFNLSGISPQEPAVLIDFGSTAIDVAIYDEALFVNSTIPGGGEALTTGIANTLKITRDEAYVIKCLNGIGESKNKEAVLGVVKPQVESLVREIQKMMRYYAERSANSKKEITKVLALGGGSNMPGFIQYLAKELSLSVQIVDPWGQMDFGTLRQLSDEERTVYLTVAGQALLHPGETVA